MVAKNNRTKPHTSRTSIYARARVASGLKYDDLLAMGFGSSTIQSCDKGKLPRSQAIRVAYLKAIGMDEKKPAGRKPVAK